MVTLVLLPGMDGTGTLFKPFITALNGAFKIQVIQYPTSESLGYEELETIARKLLPVTESFILFGESFSGPIAVSIAASQPQGLVGLVLCSTFICNPRPAFSTLGALASVLPVKLAPIALLDHFLLGRHSTANLRAALVTAVSQVSASAFRARLSAVLSIDVSSKLKLVQVPTLYLQATEDRVVPPNAAKQITRILPSVSIAPIVSPHCLLQAAPHTAAEVIHAFISEKIFEYPPCVLR